MSIGSEITQLLLNQGTIAANRAERQGQIAGQTIAGVGQSIGGAIQQATDPKMQEYRRQQQGRAALTEVLKTTPPNADGSPNHQAIISALGARGFPDVGEAWGSTDVKNQENLASLGKMKSEAVTAARNYQAKQMETIGDAAYHGDTPDKFLASVGYLTAHGQIDEKTANSVLDQAQQAGPDGWQRVRETFLQHSPAWIEAQKKKDEPFTLPPTPAGAAPAERVVGGAVVATGGKPADKPKTKEELAADATNPNSPTKAASQATLDALNAGTTPAAKPENYRVKGVGDVPLEVVPGRGPNDSVRYFLNQGNGTPRREVFAGKDFTAIPAAALQTQAAAQSAVQNLPPWALDSSRPVGAEGNVMHSTLRMTPNGLFQDAQTVIATGQYPQMSRGNDPASQAKRAAIDSKIGAIAAAAGMDVPTLRAFYKSNAKSLQQQQSAYDVASVAISKADRDVDLLEKILPKVGDTGSPLFNKPLRAFEKDVAGNADLSEMATRLRSVQSEYTRILNASPTGAGGGVMSDSARHEVDALLAGNATVPQMLRSIAALKSEGANRLLSQGEQIQRIQQRMQSNGGDDRVKVKGPKGETGTVPKGTALPSGWSLQ